MRVYFDEIAKVIVVRGAKRVFPAESLNLQVSGTDFELWLTGESRRIAGPVPWPQVQNKHGTSFATQGEAIDYIEGVLATKELQLSRLPNLP